MKSRPKLTQPSCDKFGFVAVDADAGPLRLVHDVEGDKLLSKDVRLMALTSTFPSECCLNENDRNTVNILLTRLRTVEVVSQKSGLHALHLACAAK